jgi:hypothetical protein
MLDLYPDAVYRPNKDGKYPLHIACMYICDRRDGHYPDESIVQKLNNLWPHIWNQSDVNGHTPFHDACQSGCQTIIQLFPIPNIPPIIADVENKMVCGCNTVVNKSAGMSIPMIRSYWDIHINAVDNTLDTPLHGAIHGCYRFCADYVLIV